MNRRPITIIIVSVGFVLIGMGGFLRGLWPLVTQGAAIKSHDLMDSAFVGGLGLIALLSGVFLFRGANWARWLCVGWMAVHVALSVVHTTLELVIHSVFLLVLIFVLFLGTGSKYLQSAD